MISRSFLTTAIFAAAIALLVLACGGDGDTPVNVTVRAEIVEADAPASVEVSEIEETEDGLLYHEVRVRWEGDEARRLDDARFTHHVEGDNGDLVIAGRHCGAEWDEERQMVSQPCLEDLLLVILEPGEVHAYPVNIYPEVGPLRLREGVYVVEELIHWWPVDDFGVEPFQQSENSFTVRLTYEVR